MDETLSPMDPLEFSDQKSYPDRVKESQEKTGLQDALRTGTGERQPGGGGGMEGGRGPGVGIALDRRQQLLEGGLLRTLTLLQY
jgi:hypothetical protein